MAPKVDRKKCLEEDFTKTDQPRREAPSQVRMVGLASICASQAECYDKNWKSYIKELLAFKNAHGHCEVPVNSKENSDLGKWVLFIRGSKTPNKMSAERMEELDNIGLRHGRDPSTGLAFGIIDSTKKISQQTQKEGSSPQRKIGEQVLHAPQNFQALDNGQFDDSLDTDDPEDGFVSSGVSHGENMEPKVDRKKCLEEDSTKTDQPRREAPSQVRMVDLYDVVPTFKAQDLQHYSCLPFNDSANESLSSSVREERRENMALMEDDEMDLLEKLRFASG
jgi:hypothetical protein